MFMFLHLFCPYEINAAAKHNTMHPMSSAVFLLLFTVKCIFRGVFLPVHLPAPRCTLAIPPRKRLCLLCLHTRHSLLFHCMLTAYFSFALVFSVLISLSLLSSLAELGCLTSCTSPQSTSTLGAAAVW